MGFAQNGTVTGTVTDKDMNNESLPFANIVVKGTAMSTTTDEMGVYKLEMPAGNYTLVFAFLGYESVEIPVALKAGETKTINQALGSTSVQLEDVVIEKTINRERETALLLEQKNAVEITQTIGAQEMSRKGVSDAEGAVTKVTGISKQQGEKNVFVRGLGDRYNSTTMNGLPLPSEDPIYKNISLDFFSSDVIKNIGVNKTFSSSIYGDVGGANIDILSKEFTGNDYIEIGISSGINSQTYNKDFKTIDGENFFGFSEKNPPVGDLTNYSFENSLDPGMQSSQIATGASVSGGKRFDIGDNTLSMFLVGAFSNGYQYREGTVRQTNNQDGLIMDMDFERYSYTVSQTIMGNFKYRFNTTNTISFNSLYIHDNTQDLGEYFGFAGADAFEDDLEFTRRQQTNNNNIFVNQILSELTLSEKLTLDLGAAYNMTRTSEPDRRSNNFILRDGAYRPNSDSAGTNERYFGIMNEDDLAGRAVATYNFGNESESKLDFGLNARHTKREFEATIYNHDFQNTFTPVDIDNLDATFNQESLENGLFELETNRGGASNPNALEPYWYDANRSIFAGLANFTHSFNPDLTLVVGARAEKVNMEVEYDTNIAKSSINGPAEIDEFYVLPGFNLKYTINEKNIIRLAGSMTYTLPQFVEIAPFKYSDISFSVQGNPDLVPSQNLNIDLKWELYPESDELIAVTGFYKHIKDPINRSEIPSAGNTLTFFNTGGNAMVAGAELEVRKNIYKVASEDTSNETVFSGGLNVSYLHSRQELEATLPSFTKEGETEELQGASPLLVNADLTFRRSTENFGLTSSLVLNYFSDRIYSIGTRNFQNVIETGIPTLDFITQTSIGEHFGISFKARNLLNPEFTLTRESAGNNPETVLAEYKLGLDFSVGVSYKF